MADQDQHAPIDRQSTHTRSIHSQGSRHSSATFELLAKARQDAAAALVELRLGTEINDLKHQTAKLELEKLAAVASAKFEAIRSTLEEEEDTSIPCTDVLSPHDKVVHFLEDLQEPPASGNLIGFPNMDTSTSPDIQVSGSSSMPPFSEPTTTSLAVTMGYYRPDGIASRPPIPSTELQRMSLAATSVQTRPGYYGIQPSTMSTLDGIASRPPIPSTGIPGYQASLSTPYSLSSILPCRVSMASTSSHRTSTGLPSSQPAGPGSIGLPPSSSLAGPPPSASDGFPLLTTRSPLPSSVSWTGFPSSSSWTNLQSSTYTNPSTSVSGLGLPPSHSSAFFTSQAAPVHWTHLPSPTWTYDCARSPNLVQQQRFVAPAPPPQYTGAMGRHQLAPHAEHGNVHAQGGEGSNLSNYCEYLYKRDVLTENVLLFDDDPAKFRMWKNSINKLAKNANLSSDDILGFMLQKSKETSEAHGVIERMIRVFISNPELGLSETWTRLHDRFGSDDQICHTLYEKLESLPIVSPNDPKALQNFTDVLEEVNAANMDMSLHGLVALDTPTIMKPIIAKLPKNLQDKWISEAYKYKALHNVVYPPFSLLTSFLVRMSLIRNDPGLMVQSHARISTYNTQQEPFFTMYRTGLHPTNDGSGLQTNSNIPYGGRPGIGHPRQPTPITDHRNSPHPDSNRIGWPNADRTNPDSHHHQSPSFTKVDDLLKSCPIHDRPHPLVECRLFRRLPLADRKKFLEEHKICSRCITAYHATSNCKVQVQCKLCAREHRTALHGGPPTKDGRTSYGEEPNNNNYKTQDATPAADGQVENYCTTVCGDGPGISCSKIILAKVYPANQPSKATPVYVIIDEMSNRSLATPDLLDHLSVTGPEHVYILNTCAGSTKVSGRKAHNLVIESIDGSVSAELPTITECENISCGKAEVPDPAKVSLHPHLRSVARHIPPPCKSANISLLLGRDAPRFIKVHETVNGGANDPWAHRLELGWTVMGSLCLNGKHIPSTVNAQSTVVYDDNFGRPTNLEPCNLKMAIKDASASDSKPAHVKPSPISGSWHNPGATVFETSPDDNKLGLSVEDRKFMDIMEKGFRQIKDGHWEAPLPFKENQPPLPSNRSLALKRFKSLTAELQKKPTKNAEYFGFMQKIFENNHAEIAPPNTQGRWYLPHFGVYHPRKQKLRVVFDSSAVFRKNFSLNRALLTGPNMVANLSAVLMKFRLHKVGFVADIEQMFHSFMVYKDHRDYLRFFWFANNDPNDKVIEYRMRVHVFGNAPSPSVAICGLTKTADVFAAEFGEDCRNFVYHHFYVDDGLKSMPDDHSAIDLLSRTKEMLASANLRLHKIASNSQAVMDAFPPEERAQDLRDIHVTEGDPPLQCSLGVAWDIKPDTFTIRHPDDQTPPFTRSGASGAINVHFDPLGFTAPVTTTGKILLRRMTCKESGNHKLKWDDPLPEADKPAWTKWYDSLTHLSEIKIPRTYCTQPISTARERQLHVFSDASSDAIAACILIRVLHTDGSVSVAFVKGKSKLAPKTVHTIPRLELCAATLAVELYQEVVEEIGIEISRSIFYTDSKVVLGYILNETTRFYVFVANRVEKIRKYTNPAMWRYVPTHLNPADTATRTFATAKLADSLWLKGPPFLLDPSEDFAFLDGTDSINFNIDSDPEIRPVTVRATHAEDTPSLQVPCSRFENFSSWSALVSGVQVLVTTARSLLKAKNRPINTFSPTKGAENLIIRAVQSEVYGDDITDLLAHGHVAKTSTLRDLNPVLHDGILVVGGRIRKAKFSDNLRHPVIFPKAHHVSKLIVRHFHQLKHHQGRQITLGTIRQHGYWIVGASRLVTTCIRDCITCRKLRGKFLVQFMADLPAERLTEAPVFTYVGMDVFGPWQVVARKTRGGLAEAKRYGLIFVCMTVRAVHIELLENMSSPCLINAMRRFMALRGPVKGFFSDRGSNFIGANNLDNDFQDVEAFLKSKDCSWTFNPPHASHMGGCWERLIGVCRRVLEGILANPKYSLRLTHDILNTLMAEVCAIVNARPLIPVSTDPQNPRVLSPSQILTMKPETLSAPELTNIDLRCVWKIVQNMADEFWKLFKLHYLSALQTRRKWLDINPNVNVGDIVLIRQDTARNDWPMARVIDVKMSSDNLVRSVKLKIPTADPRDPMKIVISTLDRPISQLVMLIPTGSEND